MVEETTALSKIEEQALASPDWEKQVSLVKELIAKNCSPEEGALLIHMAKNYGLNPLRKEIWAVKYMNKPALIFVGRDGLLSIAHRMKNTKGEPVFGSMQTTVEIEVPDPNSKIKYMGSSGAIKKPVSATCTIWRTDYDKPFTSTVYFDEYDRKMALWKEKPKAMLMKVAESTCLRRAFNISGLYTQEEMPYANKTINVDIKEVDTNECLEQK